MSDCKYFSFNNFKYCLTLFLKCFSSFNYSTYVLSVSDLYLALDEIYHPFRAAFLNNLTHQRSFIQAQSLASDEALTLYDLLFQVN